MRGAAVHSIPRLLECMRDRYAMRMTAQRKQTYFGELTGEAQRVADEWLDGYLQVVLRLARARRDHRDRDDASYPQGGIDDVGGTGTIGTSSSNEDAPQ